MGPWSVFTSSQPDHLWTGKLEEKVYLVTALES